ncbi:MAG: hypothetical protein OXN89_07350 [Bryobacterales bacterium]|nr:hypothetical protein [Bryobacterales bacterium]
MNPANPIIAADSILNTPEAFIQHSVFPHPSDLDTWGGEELPGPPEAGRPLNRRSIARAFELPDRHLEERGDRAHVYIFGSAALVLAHRSSRKTMDADAL